MTGGRFPSVAALTVSAPSRHPSKDPPAFPPSTAFWVPVGGFPVDSRRRQRSFALNHIPLLPIPHGLEYPLGSRMHLVVIHPRLEARGRPFPRSPRSCSRVNLRVLRPLTRGPQGQPSPLWTPHGCPGVQGILPTSRYQAPHGWPMVHHSMATGSPITRGCCSALSFTLIHNPAMSRCPFATSCHPTLPIPRVFSRSPGAVVRPLPPSLPCPVPFSHPSSCVYTPVGHQQPSGAGPLDPLPSRDRFVCLARVASNPPPLCLGGLIPTCWGPFPLVPPPFFIPLPVPITHRAACIFCVFSTLPLATLRHLPAIPFLVP